MDLKFLGRQIKSSLDDMPSLTRELSMIMRKHRQKQDANKDGVTGIDKFNDRTGFPVQLKKPFTRNDRHDPEEFDWQLGEQMGDLRGRPASEWLESAEGYEPGMPRSSASTKAQRDARDDARIEMYNALRDLGFSKADADKGTADWLKTQDATHTLDGVAGGDVSIVSGMGDSNVNRSLGAQWPSRVQQIKDQLLAAQGQGVDLSSVYVDIIG